MSTLFSSMSSMIIQEGCKSETCKCDSLECDQACKDFDDTLAGLDTTAMTYTIDSLPVLKDESCECGEGCKESYNIGYDMLTKLIEAYDDIKDEFDAHAAVCEHYGFEPEQLAVVVECDEINKGLLNKAKITGDCGLINGYCGCIKNMINKGIRVVKKG